MQRLFPQNVSDSPLFREHSALFREHSALFREHLASFREHKTGLAVLRMHTSGNFGVNLLWMDTSKEAYF
jgi:hypothetical protein